MLYLRTLGGLTLENGGSPLTGAGAQRSRLALLAVLAAAGDRGISRDSLLAIFWPESDTEQARGALKQALYALRRDLGGPELISGNGNLVLSSAVIGSDVAEFNRALEQGELERAVVLYRGKFLEGVHLAGGEFDRWLELHRQHLHELYQDALGRLARSAESRSEYPEAVSWWRVLAVADPLSALVAGSLMRALAKAGDGAAALRHAQIYEQLVKTELGAAPDRSVLELSAQISRGGVARAPGAQPETLGPVLEPASPDSSTTTGLLSVPVRMPAAAVPPTRLRTRSLRLACTAVLGGVLLAQSSSVGEQVYSLERKKSPVVQHTYSQEKAYFGKAELVIRVPGVVLRGDTVSIAIRMTNPGGQLVRIGAVRFGLSTDSSGRQTDVDRVSSPFDTAAALHQLSPGSDYLMVKTTVSHNLHPYFLAKLRCQSALFYVVRVLLYDSYLRPRTLELPVASLRWNGNGVVLRSFVYRYYMDTRSTQYEGHGYFPEQVSPLLLGRVTKDALALEIDSTSSHCGISERAMKRWNEAWRNSHSGQGGNR